MSFEPVDERRCGRRWYLAMVFSSMATIAACSEDAPHPAHAGQLAGQVVLSGPLRGAKVSVDQLDYSVKSSVTVRAHVADTMTDDDGRFSVDTGTYSGLLLVTARGGSFTDLATGATLQLDPTAGLESIEPLDLLEQRDDALVSPVGHLIAARTRSRMAQLHDLVMAERDAEDHLGRHFGNVPWMRVKLASLGSPATSPTESVRAALVQDALSFLVQDIAQAAGASPQEVNVLTLTQQLAADIRQGPFDGNDGNSPAPGDGLQVGVCGPIAGCSAPPAGTCALGACRPLCDLYAGTPRALLAGEVTKVIQSSMLNHTGLTTGDVLAVARSMADNVDEDLFGSACVEALDRIPPRLDWAAPTPADGAYVRGSFAVRAIATDDTDPRPAVIIEGYPNVPADSAASATIDSTQLQLPDGMLVVIARARDMAGNTSTLQRAVRVDNTPPALTLDPSRYFVDGSTWWTADASPTLSGTVSDAAPVTVITSVPSGTTGAAVTGAIWSGGVAGTLDLSGADVMVTATDAAGNRTQITQHVRSDITPPQLTFGTSTVRDEAAETPTFDGNEAPVHVHTGSTVHLENATGCPAVTKFSYLLGASAPPYGSEVTGQGGPDPNPVQYVLLAEDDGVGIASGSVQYRVGLQLAGTGATTWVLDWTSAGTPNRIGPGVDQHKIGIFSDQVAQLATTEGVYHVEFRATDRLSRTTTVARCFELHLRAPPLHFQTPGQLAPDPDPIPVDHAYRLLSLSLTQKAPFRAIAARLLNSNSSGASVLDEDITNGTANAVYLDVTVVKPATINVWQTFKLSNAFLPQDVTINCTHATGPPPDPRCNRPGPPGPTYDTTPVKQSEVPISGLTFPVKIFEVDGNLAPATEVPCVVCGVNDHWGFVLPSRPGTAEAAAPPRRFRAMTMVSQVSALWPSDSNSPATEPFADTSVKAMVDNMIKVVTITGRRDPSSTGCTAHKTHLLPGGIESDTCLRMTTITPYRALTKMHLKTSDETKSSYATAPTPMIVPVGVTSRQVMGFTWESASDPLP
ncbi:MAG TPA: hypothetical protein VF516_30825 [Kofleriaceae bacterium]